MPTAVHPEGSDPGQVARHPHVLSPRRRSVGTNRVVEVGRVEDLVAVRHPLRMLPGEVRELTVQAERGKVVAPPDLVQKLKHLVAGGEVVGVSSRRHPRNEHGDDHHDAWESPDAKEATEGPAGVSVPSGLFHGIFTASNGLRFPTG